MSNNLSTKKSALIGTAVAAPIAVAAFFFGSNLQTPAPAPPVSKPAASATASPVAPAAAGLAGNPKTVKPTQMPTAIPTPAAVDLRIKGNRSSQIYHLPGCPNYGDIADRNVVWFKTHEEAKAAGYRMARNC